MTHILILNKSQHSPIATNVFTAGLMDQLTASLCSETMNYDLNFDDHHYMTLTKCIISLSMSTTTRQQVMLNLMMMSADMDYGPSYVVRAIMNLQVKSCLCSQWRQQ